MEVSIWAYLFKWEYRIGRVEFLSRFLSAHVLAFFADYLLFPIDADFAKVVAIVVGVLVYFNAAVLRSHDLNRSGYFSIWLIVPIAFVVVFFMLLFRPGLDVGNKFNARPRLSRDTWFGGISRWRQVLIGLAVAAFFIGPLCLSFATRGEQQHEFLEFVLVGSLLCSVPLLGMAFLPTLWSWFLARLAELSRAIRGNS